jgi:peptidoglycan lytic transglycosylase F
MLQRIIQFLSIVGLALALLMLSGCSESRSQLEEVLHRGEIRIATHKGPASYYLDKDGETGLEFELATSFANHLGVKLSLIVANNNAEVNAMLESGRADIAAGGISQPHSPDAPFIYGPDYQWLTRQIVYRTSHWRPTSLVDIYPDQLNMTDGTVPQSTLEKLRELTPSLSWVTHSDKDNNGLLKMVQNGEILYAVAYSNDVILARESYPEIRPAFNLTGPEPLAWAVKNSNDHSLLGAVQQFHKEITQEGKLADLIERFYGPTGFFDYVDSRKFIDKYTKRLPGLKPYFKRSADKHNIDWRLLAALSYQESHWNQNAQSRTGVRGLMMLTQVTAKQLGISNRLDPQQSIEGGARYLHSLTIRLPERISEPDRTWFALAAYNVGFAHLEDARVLTQRDGGNPDLWEEVKLRLPLLSMKKWYRKTRHGYARGYEPVKFVAKIRKYYNVLVQLTQDHQKPAPQIVDAVIIDSPVL